MDPPKLSINQWLHEWASKKGTISTQSPNTPSNECGLLDAIERYYPVAEALAAHLDIRSLLNLKAVSKHFQLLLSCAWNINGALGPYFEYVVLHLILSHACFGSLDD